MKIKKSYKIQSIIYPSLNTHLYAEHMFWGKKSKKYKNKASKKNGDKRTEKKSCVGENALKKAKGGQRLSREEIQAQALTNSRIARDNIGEETLERIAAAMTKKQQSAVEQAKRDIKTADHGRVMNELQFMMKNKDA